MQGGALSVVCLLQLLSSAKRARDVAAIEQSSVYPLAWRTRGGLRLHRLSCSGPQVFESATAHTRLERSIAMLLAILAGFEAHYTCALGAVPVPWMVVVERRRVMAGSVLTAANEPGSQFKSASSSPASALPCSARRPLASVFVTSIKTPLYPAALLHVEVGK